MHERGCVCVVLKDVGVTVYGACVKNVSETVHRAVVTVYSAWKKNMGLTICNA